MSSQNRRWLGWALAFPSPASACRSTCGSGNGQRPPHLRSVGRLHQRQRQSLFGDLWHPGSRLGRVDVPFCLAAIALYLLFSPKRSGKESPPGVAFAGFAIALSGALFSLYLTGIEAFVLRAYCIWCLVSWGIITTTAVLWARALLNKPGEACSTRADLKRPAHVFIRFGSRVGGGVTPSVRPSNRACGSPAHGFPQALPRSRGQRWP